MLYIEFGPDFVRRLYKVKRRSSRATLVKRRQFLAQGSYAIVLGPDSPEILQ